MDIMSFLTAITGISAIIIATWKISSQIGGLQSQINNLATEVHSINEFLRREK